MNAPPPTSGTQFFHGLYSHLLRVTLDRSGLTHTPSSMEMLVKVTFTMCTLEEAGQREQELELGTEHSRLVAALGVEADPLWTGLEPSLI